MKMIRVLKKSPKNIYVSSVQVEVSEACYNVPTLKIDMVQDVNITGINKLAFESETEALNSALKVLNNIDSTGVQWLQAGVCNKFVTRLLTDEQGCIATDQLISQWKNGIIKLYLTDVYITLDRK